MQPEEEHVQQHQPSKEPIQDQQSPLQKPGQQ